MKCPNCGTDNSDAETYCRDCAVPLKPTPKARGEPDWEALGNPKALKLIGIGLVLLVAGCVLGLQVHVAFIGLAAIGAFVFIGAAYYLVYFENWELLQERKKSPVPSPIDGSRAGERAFCASCGRPLPRDARQCLGCGRSP